MYTATTLDLARLMIIYYKNEENIEKQLIERLHS